jgi:hypothetical protein
VLLQCPLGALDDRSAVLTGACGDFPDPVGGALSQKFPPCWVNVPPLLVAGQGRGSRDEPCFQAAEQEGLPTKVLEVGSTHPYFLLPSRSVSDPL